MTLAPNDSPVRIGLVGCGPSGAHHFERIRLRGDFKILAACDGCDENGPVPPLFESIATGMDELLARDDLDYILITGSQNRRGDLVVRSLEAGKNVAVEPPPCVDSDEARALLAAARNAGRALCVLPSRRAGLDFRAANQTVLAGSIGTIEAARLLSWAKAVPPHSGNRVGSTGVSEIAPGDEVFTFFAYQYVDQLLQLMRRSAETVFARIAPMHESDPTATAFFLSIAFRGGADALIDVNLHAGAALQTGWILAGTSGAYSQQRIHIAEPSGEICDVPIVPADVPQLDLYAGMLPSAVSQEDRLDSAREALLVMRVIDAARESARMGQVVGLDAGGSP